MDTYIKNRLFIMLAVLFFSGNGLAETTSRVTFDQLDTNRDGQLSAVEASKDSQLSKLWTEVDQDKTGSIDRTEFSAFEAMLEQAEPTNKPLPKSGAE